jgi:hypothetical protein
MNYIEPIVGLILLLGLALYLLYIFKSALGVNLSERYHAWEIGRMLIQAIVYKKKRKSVLRASQRYLQLNQQNPIPVILRREAHGLKVRYAQRRHQWRYKARRLAKKLAHFILPPSP